MRFIGLFSLVAGVLVMSVGAANANAAKALSCATVAETLTAGVVLRESPHRSAGTLGVLKPGEMIFRCRSEGDWHAVMYHDDTGSERCPSGIGTRACSAAWVRGEPETDATG